MGLLDTNIPNFSADVVGVFDDSFRQVFSNARPLKANIKKSAKVMEHPIETGAVTTDHIIFLPIEIELFVIALKGQGRDVYSQISNLYQKGTLLNVQTRTSNYQNMIITDMPHDEESAVFDAVPLALKLREVQFVSAQFQALPASNVADPANASTQQRGEQQGTDPNAAQDAKTDETTAQWIWRSI